MGVGIRPPNVPGLRVAPIVEQHQQNVGCTGRWRIAPTPQWQRGPGTASWALAFASKKRRGAACATDVRRWGRRSAPERKRPTRSRSSLGRASRQRVSHASRQEPGLNYCPRLNSRAAERRNVLPVDGARCGPGGESMRTSKPRARRRLARLLDQGIRLIDRPVKQQKQPQQKQPRHSAAPLHTRTSTAVATPLSQPTLAWPNRQGTWPRSPFTVTVW